MIRNNMKTLRTARGWSQQQLATISGVSRAAICDIENGITKSPGIDVCYAIERALDVDIHDIFVAVTVAEK